MFEATLRQISGAREQAIALQSFVIALVPFFLPPFVLLLLLPVICVIPSSFVDGFRALVAVASLHLTHCTVGLFANIHYRTST